MKKVNHLIICITTIATFMVSACVASNAQPTNTLTNSTGIVELDKIIDIVLSGDASGLKSIVKFTQAKCTSVEGLGGPPKCMQNEKVGSVIEVLPILDSEGYFVRKDEMKTWDGIDVSALFAVYEVSELVYSDENYPAGEFAIVFINTGKSMSITLQIDQSHIVRIDHGFEYPPLIPEENVIRYLIQPIKGTQ